MADKRERMMGGYDFLRGMRVLEVAHLGPSSLGGYLADMGADVIKVEGEDGDTVRYAGTPAVGSPDGVSLLHLRWNRGKRSIGIDLKTPAGIALFRRLAADCDVVIEGMRAGILDRLGLGFETLRVDNRRIVFCSISGLGRSGPYHRLGSHGPSFDAFAGLSWTNPYALSPDEQARSEVTPVGMHAMGLYAALGTLAAVIRARETGEGALIEVAAADAAAHWRPDGVDKALNPDKMHERPGFLGDGKRMACWPRLSAYPTADGKAVFFQGLSPKFWVRFCAAVERPDLAAAYGADEDVNAIDARIEPELRALFLTRPLADWMDLFRAHDVPGGPANSPGDLATDPHFLARDNVYAVDHPEAGPLRLTSTPVKTPDQAFAPAPAPGRWADTASVLREVLALDDAALAALRTNGTIF